MLSSVVKNRMREVGKSIMRRVVIFYTPSFNFGMLTNFSSKKQVSTA
jgi:hypothetical protein